MPTTYPIAFGGSVDKTEVEPGSTEQCIRRYNRRFFEYHGPREAPVRRYDKVLWDRVQFSARQYMVIQLA